MFTTVHEGNLRAAYEILNILYDREGDKAEVHRRRIKQAIRTYHKIPTDLTQIVSSDYDSLLVVFPLPAELKSYEAARDYFLAHYFREAAPSMYDCTGQIFTTWYKIFKRRDQFWVYHATAMDV